MPGRRAAGLGNPGELLCHMALSVRFYGNGVSVRLISGQSPCLTQSDSVSFLVACTSLCQDGFQREGLWEVGHLLPLLAPPEFSWLIFEAAPCSFLAPPVVRQLRQVVLAKVAGFGQQFPNRSLRTRCQHGW